jgi:hypothetical protein
MTKQGLVHAAIHVLARTVLSKKTTKPNANKRQTVLRSPARPIIELDLAAPRNYPGGHIYIISGAAAIGSKVAPPLRAFWG